MTGKMVENKEEILKDIISDYEKKGRKEQKSKERSNKRREAKNKLRRLFKIAGVCAIIVLIFRFFVIMVNSTSAFHKPEYWAIGGRLSSDYKIEGCIGNLWQIRKDSDLYYAANKRFPPTVDELYKGNYLRRGLICPASGRKYIFKEIKGRKVFCCPEPERHGVTEIWCDVKGGPPAIER